MLEAYSLNVTVPADTAIPFNNVSIQKGCIAVLDGVSTVKFNSCGVYMVACNASTSAPTTIQLFKDGIAQADAQNTGTSPSFTKLVQVAENNSNCPCSSPTTIQVKNVGDASATFTDCNITVTKLC